MGSTWWRRSPSWPAAVVAALCLLVGLSSNSGAAATSSPEAYFVDQNGTVTAFVESAGGTTVAAVGNPQTAPPGAPIAAVRTASGDLIAFTVGNDGSIVRACPLQGTFSMTKPGAASKGAKLTAAVVDGRIRLAYALPQSYFYALPQGYFLEDIIDPCGEPSVPSQRTTKLTAPWAVPGGDFAMATLTDGRTMIAAFDGNGALHVLWVSPVGAVTDSVLTPNGTATPGEPIAVTPKSNATPSTLVLFYTGLDGRMYEVRPGAPAAPVPHPTAADVPAGAGLAAATGPAGDFVTYVADSGAVTVLPTDPAGNWQPAFPATANGFATRGSGVAATAGAAEDDIYCGNGTRPVRVKVGPHGPGPGTVWPAGPPNTVGPQTEFAAS